jgi:transposase
MLHTTLNDTQCAQLRQLARQAVGRVSERAHFLLLSAQGYSPLEIGRLMGYDTATVRHWLKIYQRREVAGLYDAARCGRHPKDKLLTAVVQAQASQPPPNMGYVQACWTVALLLGHLWQRFRIRVSATTLRQALRRAGYRWTRPRLALPRKRDPQAEPKQARLAEALGQAEATVVAEDECDMHLLAVVRAMWQRLGQQLRIATPGQNAKRGVFGALNLRTGQWHYHLTERKRGVEFMAFLEALLVAYPLGSVYVIVDNASIHTSRAVRRWLGEHARLQLLYLPTYSGHQLNPVEKVWGVLKDHIAANRCFKSLAQLDQAMQRHFADFTCPAALRMMNGPLARTAQAVVALK